ncbi:uncharacterized protein LOC127719919 isoform X1 [Mytilus californianus]|uniref:uncharacterized protein LOC127719919 isoform X1 n=2 Tax=Mytilus californianus TaxID=6549 RepID=UPI0022460BBF|nr:uncharacterized protein LOC127719919 isoform X1 [Mytilus californianus]
MDVYSLSGTVRGVFFPLIFHFRRKHIHLFRTRENNMEDQKTVVNKQVVACQTMSEENLLPYTQTNSQRSRTLGLLETMYHTYTCREIDVCPVYFKMSTKHPVTRHHVKEALFTLVDEFAALRLTIVQTGRHSYKFVERKRMPVSIHEKYTNTNETILNQERLHKFDFSRGPLWKFTWLKNPTKHGENALQYPFHFFFIFHHAISDFHQIHTIVQSLTRNILHSQRVLPTAPIYKRHLCPSIEHVIPLDFVRKVSQTNDSTKWPTCAIDTYNAAFNSEIAELQKRNLSTAICPVQLNETDSRSFFRQCKHHNVKITSAIVAAMTVSFTQLIQTALPPSSSRFVVPVEIMVDLTRYIVDDRIKQSFGSVGAIHLPFLVEMNLLDLKSKGNFWSIAQQCQTRLDQSLATGEPMKVLLRDVPSEIHNEPEIGKSPFVLSISNMGSLDDIIPETCKHEIQLEDFIPWTNVTVDDMPVFCTGFLTFNGSLKMVAGYCNSYTSKQTTDLFTSSLRQLLINCSKL